MAVYTGRDLFSKLVWVVWCHTPENKEASLSSTRLSDQRTTNPFWQKNCRFFTGFIEGRAVNYLTRKISHTSGAAGSQRDTTDSFVMASAYPPRVFIDFDCLGWCAWPWHSTGEEEGSVATPACVLNWMERQFACCTLKSEWKKQMLVVPDNSITTVLLA